MKTRKRVLFVCDQNRLRSPSAQALYADHNRIEAQSAGLGKEAETPVTEELLTWADQVFVMERRQRNIIHKRWPDLYASREIICLYVPDEYEFMEPALLRILAGKLKRYIGEPSLEIEAD
jgi:predicted protein tyrosine phosphatase